MWENILETNIKYENILKYDLKNLEKNIFYFFWKKTYFETMLKYLSEKISKFISKICQDKS